MCGNNFHKVIASTIDSATPFFTLYDHCSWKHGTYIKFFLVFFLVCLDWRWYGAGRLKLSSLSVCAYHIGTIIKVVLDTSSWKHGKFTNLFGFLSCMLKQEIPCHWKAGNIISKGVCMDDSNFNKVNPSWIDIATSFFTLGPS